MVKSSNQKQQTKVAPKSNNYSNRNKLYRSSQKAKAKKISYRKRKKNQQEFEVRDYFRKNRIKNKLNRQSRLSKIMLQNRNARPRRPKRRTLSLNKPENIFNLAILKSLRKPSMDLNILKENDASPKPSKSPPPNMDIDTNDSNDAKVEEIRFKLSNLPTTYEPGTSIELAPQINVRHWKTVQNTHNSKLIAFNPKAKSFAQSMFDKKQKESMKRVEDKLRDEIRADKRLHQMKKHQREEMRKQNILRGCVVKPIRNMHKLKKFSRKQWRSVMKASVEIHNARNRVRNTFVPRQLQ